MLEAPRELLAWALALLDDPPKALVFRAALLLGTWRFPILFPPPPLPRFAPMLLAPAFEPARLAPPAPMLLGRAPELEAARLPALGCCRALACRVDMESPRAVPPYLFAVAVFE
jgi:hypothetical protein